MNHDDEILRAKLNEGRPYPSRDALQVLNTLKPSMRRSRRHRHVAIGAVAAALLGIGVAGVVVTASSPRTTLRTSTSASAPSDSGPVDSATREPDSQRPPTTEVRLGSTTANTARSDEDSTPPAAEPRRTEDGTPADSSVGPGVEAKTPSAPGHPSSIAETRPTSTVPLRTTTPESEPSTASPPVAPEPEHTVPTTEMPTTTNTAGPQPTSPPTNPREESIASACGSVVVRVVGSAVEFVRAVPHDGFQVDVRDRGPDEVEVRFDDATNECRVRVRVDNGELRIRVEDDRGGD